jgi:CBS domain-containing protein
VEKMKTEARDFMQTHIVSIHPGAPLLAASKKMQEHGISALPVIEDGVLVGVVTQQHITVEALDVDPDLENEIVADHMILSPVFCQDHDSLERVRSFLEPHGIDQLVLPVLDERGKLVGVIGKRDLAEVGGLEFNAA